MTAVLIYTRLSTEDVHDATVRQEVACRSYAEARNWDVAGALGDLDASVYQPRVRRPGFETLITEAAARSADGVLVGSWIGWSVAPRTSNGCGRWRSVAASSSPR
jgi:DNA invertase Pin-like site-specific DNA recombinase